MDYNENFKKQKQDNRNGFKYRKQREAEKAVEQIVNDEKSIDIPKEPVKEEPKKKKYYGVLTGILYSDHDVKKNQMPECVFEAEEGLSEKEISNKAFAERIERNCADCKGCTSYNYFL